MAYTPTNWKTGDVVTSSKLNNIETGITDANSMIVIVDFDDDTGNLDITAGEFMALGVAQKLVMTRTVENEHSVEYDIIRSFYDGNGYSFSTMYGSTYTASTESDHPQAS